LEFRILGPLEVVDDDGLIEITAPQQRALLAALLLHANQVLPAGRLIDLLWGPAPPETARNTVQAYVHRLRQALADVANEPLRAQARRLEEARLRVWEECAAAELELGPRRCRSIPWPEAGRGVGRRARPGAPQRAQR
jgi:Transcriptional regulatory protein, C terminal